MFNTPIVDIIVLNWNNFPDTENCLQQLKKIEYPSYRIIVVDNASTDGSKERIRIKFPRVILIENNTNLGFTGGNNLGMCLSIRDQSDYVLLLNNDTEVTPDFLRYLVDAAESDPSIGVSGPIINFFSNPRIIWSAGGKIDWHRGKTLMVGYNQVIQKYFGSKTHNVDFLTGCAMLVKVKVIQKIGLLDDRFFAYYEDVEWCVRIRKNNFKIVVVPKSIIYHKISIKIRDHSPTVLYYMTRNRLLFLKLAKAGLLAWFNTLIIEYLRTLISWSIRPKWRHKKNLRKAMVIAISDVIMGRLGAKNLNI